MEQKKVIDEFLNCRVCGKKLTAEEKQAHIEASLPATCTKDLEFIKKQLEICAPIFAEMSL